MNAPRINKMCLEIINLIYMYERDLALNNLQWLICHKTKPEVTEEIQTIGPNKY